MNAERNDLEARAGRHAALADPVRLRVADLLALSDRSPAELQAELGISSSLLAHHINVLVRAGIVARHRSEGDRRRNYLQLLPHACSGLGPSAAAAARRVIFVCKANSARSQFAAALWQERSDIPVASAGTHPAASIAPRAIEAARRHGVRSLTGEPRSIDEVLGADDFVVTVCDAAREELDDTADVHWSVPDPVTVGTDAAFNAAFETIAVRVDDLAARLTPA